MRLLLITLLFSPSLFALDMKDVDRDTCRYTRLALLKDGVRKHFDLRIGDFESLDQALRVDVKMDKAEHLLVLRLGTRAAAVLILTDGRTDKAGAHCFFEVESVLSAESAFDSEYVTLACRAGEDELPIRTRLLRYRNGKLQLCFTWISEEEIELEGGRYRINTRRTLAKEAGLLLETRTEYLLEGKLVEGGLETSTTSLRDGDEEFTRETVDGSPIAVATHCAIARKLERDGLNEAALHHARAAKLRATIDKLADDDASRLEAQALAARLEARLRPVQVTRR